MVAAYLALCSLLADIAAPVAGSMPTTVAEAQALRMFSGADRFEASVRAETRAGEGPVLPGLPTGGFMSEAVMPRLQLDIRGAVTTWTTWYGPRFYWQEPRVPSAPKLLVLHEFGSSLALRLSRTTGVTGAVGGSIGQHDYTSLQQALGPGQAMLPTAPNMVSVSGGAALTAQPGRRWMLGVRAGVFYWEYLQTPAPETTNTAPPGVTGSFSLIGGPQVAFRATHLDWLGLDLSISDFRYGVDAEQLVVTPTATWSRALAPQVDLHLRLGVAYARSSFSPAVLAAAGMASSEAAESPIGSVDVASKILRWDQLMLASRAFVGLDYYLDPVLAVGVRRWAVGAGVDALARPDWAFELRGDFATSFREIPVGPDVMQPDQTVFSLTLSIHRRLSGHGFAELEGQWSDRAPALGTPDFHFHQRQLWVSVTFGATTEPIPR